MGASQNAGGGERISISFPLPGRDHAYRARSWHRCVCGRCEFVCSHVPPGRRHDAEGDGPGFTFEANRDPRHREKVVDEPVVTMRPSRFAEMASPSHAVCEEVPEPMDAANHLDVAVEQLGVARRASQYDRPAADELARGVEGF